MSWKSHHRHISQIRLHRAIGTHGWTLLHQTLSTPLVRPRKAHYKGFYLHPFIWQNHRHLAYGRTLQDRQRLRCSELVQRLLRRIPEPGCRTGARSRQSLWPWSILPPWPAVPPQPERNRIRRWLDWLRILAADIQWLLHAAAIKRTEHQSPAAAVVGRRDTAAAAESCGVVWITKILMRCY